MLFYLVSVLIVAVGIVLALAAMKPDEFRVARSITINAPPERVFPHVNDLHAFTAWSPYTLKDPHMKRTFSGPASGKGATYAWDGDRNVGRGSIQITDSRPPSLIAIDLRMEKPIAANNLVTFTFEPRGGATLVTWAMVGNTPFVGKLMHLVFDMDKMVGNDFELGLSRLKSAVEAR